MHGGNIHYLMRNTNLNSSDWVDFSANINPLGLSSELTDLFYQSIAEAVHYPDPDYHDLYRATAVCFGCDEKHILLGNGAVDVLYQWLHKMSPRKAIIPAPTFSEYEKALKGVNAEIIYATLHQDNNFDITAEMLAPLLTKDIDLVVLCNPNNPTGRIIPSEEMDKILRLVLSHKCYLMVDEAFMDFIEDGDKQTLISKINALPQVSVLRSFTKIFAMPGIRLGAVVAGNSQLIAQCKEEAVPWKINAVANAFHRYINTDDAKEYTIKTRHLITKERQWLYNHLSALQQLKVINGAANYLLVHWKDNNRTVAELRERLLQSGIVIRDCSTFIGLDERWFRVAVKNRNENERLVSAIKDNID